MNTPREKAHEVVGYCSFGPKHPLAHHSEECDAATEAIENARIDGAAVALLALTQVVSPSALPTGAITSANFLIADLLRISVEKLRGRGVATITALAILLFTLPARADDPIPFFKPDYFQFFKPDPKPAPTPTKPYGPPRPHRVATECAVDDRACIRAHDDRALDLAVYTHDRSWCSQAVRASWCTALYEFVYDDGPGAVKRVVRSTDPMLYDPCTFVVSIDSGRATLYSFRLKRWLVTKDESWERAEFIGECDVDKLPPRLAQGVQTLPGFPWVRHAREP